MKYFFTCFLFDLERDVIFRCKYNNNVRLNVTYISITCSVLLMDEVMG